MAKPTPETTPETLKFEASLAELEGIVREMEGGTLELEESILAYRRGVDLLRHCREKLVVAEEQIRILDNSVAAEDSV